MGQALHLARQPTWLPYNVHRLKVPCGTKSRGESEDFLRRAKAAQRVQSCGDVPRGRMGSRSRTCAGAAGFQRYELGDSSTCWAHRTEFCDRYRVLVVVRAEYVGALVHGRYRTDVGAVIEQY